MKDDSGKLKCLRAYSKLLRGPLNLLFLPLEAEIQTQAVPQRKRRYDEDRPKAYSLKSEKSTVKTVDTVLHMWNAS